MQPNPDPSWLSKNQIYFCYVGVKINCQRARPACLRTARCEIHTRCSSSISLQYVSHTQLNVGTSPPAESKTEATQTRLLPKQTTPDYGLSVSFIPHTTGARCCFSSVLSSPAFTPVHLLIYQPAPRLTCYCNVNAVKHPTTGRSASGDCTRD